MDDDFVNFLKLESWISSSCVKHHTTPHHSTSLYTTQTSQHEEMGLELLSLVNARMALLKEAEVLRYERDNLKNSALGLETHVKSAQTAQTTSEVGSFEMPCS